MFSRNLFRRSLTLTALLTAMAAPILGQEGKKKQPDATKKAPEIDPRLQRQLKSPQHTMRTLLATVNDNRLDEAADCLTLTGQTLTEDARTSAGGRLAFKLKETIDRMVRVELSRIPDEPDSDQPYRLAYQAAGLNDQDIADAGSIVIDRGKDGLWRFSAETVARIDDLYERWQSREKVQLAALNKSREPFSVWLEKRFPKSMRQVHFLFADYQWICILLLIFIGFVVDLLTRLLLGVLTSVWFRFRRGEEPPERKRLWKPVGLFAQALVWYSGTLLIGLPHWALSVLLVLLKLFAVVAAIWTTFRFIDLLSGAMKRKAESTETKFDDLLIPLVSKSLKFFAFCIGIVLCAEAFNWQITGLLAGVGIGGMALALASQDAVSNLFGSATVLLDRPFEVGDWIVTSTVEGTVEAVGFRSTRVRTFYNSLVTVPNSNLTTAVVDNMGKRTFRRIKAMLGVEYGTTPAQIDAFCEGIRELIRRHPYTRKDYFHVYLNQFSASSLDILLYCFIECPDWSIELRERHRLLIDIMKLADELSIGFAFPTQTLHMLQQEPPQSESGPISDPEQLGQQTAANIAGPLLPPSERPGGVKFVGPVGDTDAE